MNGAFYEPENVSQVVDVMGFNYYPNDYDRMSSAEPWQADPQFRTPARGRGASAIRRRPILALDEIARLERLIAGGAEIASRPSSWAAVWTSCGYGGDRRPSPGRRRQASSGITSISAADAADIRRAQWRDDIPSWRSRRYWTAS